MTEIPAELFKKSKRSNISGLCGSIRLMRFYSMTVKELPAAVILQTTVFIRKIPQFSCTAIGAADKAAVINDTDADTRA